VAGRAKRLAPSETAGGEPATLDDTVAAYGFVRVVRTRRQEPAGACKLWRNNDFVASNQSESRLSGPGDGQGVFGSRLQGYSGWRRGVRA
jgi:hypothetical protein